LLGIAVALLPGRLAAQGRDSVGFDHIRHAKVFVSCTTCHAGAAAANAPLFPPTVACAACHDGTLVRRVTWAPRVGPPATNLTFDHGRHRTVFSAAAARQPGREAPLCGTCHIADSAGWMGVQPAVVRRCLDCHGIRRDHFSAPDTACGTCHRPLAQAPTLSESRIARFPVPPSHRDAGFIGRGPASHGELARSVDRSDGFKVAESCATCHARDFCINCHVNAPETRAIQALAPDARSLVIRAKLEAPASHRSADFERAHGRLAGHGGEQCATCHTRESCAVCHSTAPPTAVAALAAAGPGRAAGAWTVRRRPQSHRSDFDQHHASVASAKLGSCATCHARAMCLECHRPDAGRTGFHPAGFLAVHPAAAYNRQSQCADCHNQGQFCATCHAQSGLGARTPLGVAERYHDSKRYFLLGHGQAARQNLETCVSCHVERDCLRCHSAMGGRRFNPHGPGFDPDRLLRKNPEVCIACHGVSIPRR
jgi:hypothetical protein